ncbi:MAG: heme exporter protein CcmB [Dehalococcoidia bacterium]|nr:heme exporter protein CcmB [Dehalococcoidia bacterium]
MKKLIILLKKDIQLAWLDKSAWLSAIAFGTISIIFYNLTIDLFVLEVDIILPGLLWITFLFCSILISSNSFTHELDNGIIDGMKIANVPITLIAISKTLVNYFFILSIQSTLLLIVILFFNIQIESYYMLIYLAFMTLGFTSLLTCLAPLSYQEQSGTMLTYIIVIPLLIPLILTATRVTFGVIGTIEVENHWIFLGVLFSLWQTTVSIILFQFIIEE